MTIIDPSEDDPAIPLGPVTNPEVPMEPVIPMPPVRQPDQPEQPVTIPAPREPEPV